MKRKLICIEAWHNRVECQYLDDTNWRQANKKNWESDYWKAAEKYWDIVDEAVARLKFKDWSKVRIYSDSIWENTDIMIKTIKKVAEMGSRHSQIMSNMLKLGAILEATEDKKLLNSKKLNLEKRDRVIAGNINKSLQPGETGILIIGTSHKNWEDNLDLDIRVVSLLSKKDYKKLDDLLNKIKVSKA